MYHIIIFNNSSHPTDSCGLNGLPLTPNSVSMLGNGQLLKLAKHPNLSQYLDIVRGKRQRIAMVSEYWKDNFRLLPVEAMSSESILKIIQQVLGALAYLNEMNIVNLNLSPENITLDGEGNVKLFGYGLGRITGYGKLVSFPIGDPRYTAPDVLARGMMKESGLELDPDRSVQEYTMNIPEEIDPPDLPQVDVWSLGIILAAKLLQIQQFWPASKVSQVLRKVLSLSECETGAAVLEKIAREHNCLEKLNTIDPNILEIIQTCLIPQSTKRPTPCQLLGSEIFNSQPTPPIMHFNPPNFPVMELRSKDLVRPKVGKYKTPFDFLMVREIYYLWQLAGGDVMTELLKHGLMITTPPVISTPSLVTGEGQVSLNKLNLNFVKKLHIDFKHLRFL